MGVSTKENDMRVVHAAVLAIVIAWLAPAVGAQDADRTVAGGGISVPGWKGKTDRGTPPTSSKFVQQGKDLHLTIGPAAIYWNPANTASGDYTVKATFREPKMSADHPHPAGLFIGGTNLDTAQHSFVYCVAYGDGSFLVRQFNGAKVSTLTNQQPNPAVHKAGADGSVSNEIAWTVKGNRVECLINGKPVAGFDKAQLVGPGKLESTDGIYGIRVSHNMELIVSGLAMTKN
jgi:hypothetical protein